MRVNQLSPQVVELAPKELRPGVLYISFKYKLAIHLCCCGCGEKVVTPLSPAEWHLRLDDGKVTLHPSIGNWGMACKSHYYIRNNRVVWSGEMNERQIAAVHRRDKADIDAMHRAKSINRGGPDLPESALPKPSPRGNWFRKLWDWLFNTDK